MFASFFSSFSQPIKWYLKPAKHSKNSPHHYSSKVQLPRAMLKDLIDFNFPSPYIFEISDADEVLKTTCSVQDFTLEDDEVEMPSWMFEQISLDGADEVCLKHIQLPKGKGIKLMPHSIDFLDVDNPKAELEEGLRNYAVLSYGNEILLKFRDIGNCRFTVTSISPESTDSIYTIDTDLNVDFDEPIGYKEKIESESTVKKYLKIGDEDREIKSLQFTEIGYFVDWGSLSVKQ